MKIFKKINTIFIAFEFLFTVIIVIFLMFLFNKYNWQIRRKWSKIQQFFIGYKVEIIGKPDENAKLLLMNHQSLLDIVIIDGIYIKNVAWVAKKEIEKIPLLGLVISLPKNISIDRENKKSLIKLFRDVKDRLKNGRVIAMFPEGTRGKGEKLLKFKLGAKKIAEKLNLIVQPAVIINSRNIVDSQNFKVNKGVVKIVYLDSIDPNSNENWYEELQQNMQKVLTDELANISSNR